MEESLSVYLFLRRLQTFLFKMSLYVKKKAKLHRKGSAKKRSARICQGSKKGGTQLPQHFVLYTPTPRHHWTGAANYRNHTLALALLEESTMPWQVHFSGSREVQCQSEVVWVLHVRKLQDGLMTAKQSPATHRHILKMHCTSLYGSNCKISLKLLLKKISKLIS